MFAFARANVGETTTKGRITERGKAEILNTPAKIAKENTRTQELGGKSVSDFVLQNVLKSSGKATRRLIGKAGRLANKTFLERERNIENGEKRFSRETITLARIAKRKAADFMPTTSNNGLNIPISVLALIMAKLFVSIVTTNCILKISLDYQTLVLILTKIYKQKTRFS